MLRGSVCLLEPGVYGDAELEKELGPRIREGEISEKWRSKEKKSEHGERQ